MMYANLSPKFGDEEEVTLNEAAPVEITRWMSGRPCEGNGNRNDPIPAWRQSVQMGVRA
jgi:hypothetical protein